MIIYIAGAISGKENYNRLEFRVVEMILSAEGNTVLNPTSYIPFRNAESISQEAYMKISFAMIDACDEVYFLDGWRDSVGATKEYEYAINRDKLIRFQEKQTK